MQDLLPSDLIIGAILTFQDCSSCIVKLIGSGSIVLMVDAVPISVESVKAERFAGNGDSYLQVLMQYPGIRQDKTVSCGEWLVNGRGFVSCGWAPFGLHSLTTASRHIRVTVKQENCQGFVVEKCGGDGFRSFVLNWPFDESVKTTVAVEAELALMSFSDFPHDHERLAERLRDLAGRRRFAATLHDLRQDSPMHGNVYLL